MATIKKASTKAISYCQGLTSETLGKSTTWEQLSDIIMDGFEISVDTKTPKDGDCTIIRLYKVGVAAGDEVIETWCLPNSEVFLEKDGDWDWALLYKTVVEYLVKNLKKINGGKKPKAKKKPKTPVDTKTLAKEVSAIKTRIKKSTGSEKKKLIKEYNEKSLMLQTELNG